MSRRLLLGALFAAVIAGGFVTELVVKFCFEIALPTMSQSNGTSSISIGGANPLVFAVVGGIPSLAISYWASGGSRVLAATRVLATVWIGPAVMSFLLLLLFAVLWPPALAVGLLFSGSVGITCGLLFELVTVLAIFVSGLSNRRDL
ncbi:hypothetical protein [Microbacterium oxydans]|uniref:hypothetical protein n=1 Tax=Microbacterium oxydans TaxID=82380 RepID=UPI0012E07D1B|nr:hypothetical protein [Microbacterium oxydans]